MLNKARWAVVLACGMFWPAIAAAHPHVVATVELKIAYGDDGRLTSLTQIWHYDAIYSAFVLRQFTKSADGTYPPDALAQFAATQAAQLADSKFFTTIKADGTQATLGAPQNAALSVDDDRLTLTFSTGVTQTGPSHAASIELFDPSFFAYFSLIKDKVEVTGRTDCQLAMIGPEPLNLKNTRTVPAAFWAALDGSADAGVQFINRVDVSCR